MHVRPADEVEQFLRDQRAADLDGTLETVTVEFKSEPYILGTPRQKQELAKDICALANASGGIVAIGLKTTKSNLHAVDVVTGANPFPREMYKAEAWLDVLTDWVYPPVSGLDAQWYPAAGAPDHGFAVIRVPTQEQSRRPYLVRRIAFGDEKADGAIFGMFERRRADAAALSVHEVQALMHDGWLFRQAINLRSGEVPAGGAGAPLAARSSTDLDKETVSKVISLLTATELREQPCMVLTAAVTEPVDIVEMFESSEHPIVALLTHPPQIRPAGFDLTTNQMAAIVEGRSRRSIVPGWKGLEVWRDGTVVFAAAGGDDFLSWATPAEYDAFRINPVTLIESILMFCRFTAEVFSLIGRPPERVRLSLQLCNMCRGAFKPILVGGPPSVLAAPWDRKSAPACDFLTARTFAGRLDPDAVAYQLAAEVYQWFGHEHVQIPFVDRTGPEPRISSTQIQALQG